MTYKTNPHSYFAWTSWRRERSARVFQAIQAWTLLCCASREVQAHGGGDTILRRALRTCFPPEYRVRHFGFGDQVPKEWR